MDNVQPFVVPRKGAGVREGLAAGGAYVGAIAGMDTHVCCQVAGAREGLAAGGADVGAIAGMGAHVGRQAAGVREGLEIGRASCRERV